MVDAFPYNAGIMLMNMPYLRKTSKAFIKWIFSQKNGLYYEGEWVGGSLGEGWVDGQGGAGQHSGDDR
jgi:hypothetical protein